MYKEIETENGRILVIEVPEDAYDFELDYVNYTPQVFVNYGTKKGTLDFPLTDGNNLDNLKFKILGKLSELSEEECSRFVEFYKSEKVYRNYVGLLDQAWDCGNSAKKSLISLLQSHKINVTDLNTILLIQKYD